jgi:hypothetical protein
MKITNTFACRDDFFPVLNNCSYYQLGLKGDNNSHQKNTSFTTPLLGSFSIAVTTPSSRNLPVYLNKEKAIPHY